jgi:hypothetical protein
MIGGAETRDMGDPIVALHLVLGVEILDHSHSDDVLVSMAD